MTMAIPPGVCRYRFGVVVPVVGWSPLVPYCLVSLAFQQGGHPLHIVVVDKSGSDEVSRLCTQLGAFAPALADVTITFVQSDDAGPAEAIERGIELLDAEIMTWLGGDDYLQPGALAAVDSFAKENSGAEWFTGVSSRADYSGVQTTSPLSNQTASLPMGFPQKAMALGLSASSKNLPFVQQEGTFWTANLWRKAGGKMETSLNYAFDFELWTRFAQHSELIQLNIPLGVFRIREGQLSSDRKSYFQEVSAVRRKIAENSNRFFTPFVATGRIALYSEARRWSFKKLSYGFWSPEQVNRIIGVEVLRRQLLVSLTTWYRTNRILRKLASSVRRQTLKN